MRPLLDILTTIARQLSPAREVICTVDVIMALKMDLAKYPLPGAWLLGPLLRGEGSMEALAALPRAATLFAFGLAIGMGARNDG